MERKKILSANQADRKEKVKANIHIHSVRKRLIDPDGCSGKAAIDGLVHAGVIPDDSADFVSGVSYSQEKGPEERTTITITFQSRSE